MTRSEAIDMMVETTGLTKEQVTTVLKAFISVIESTLSNHTLDAKDRRVTIIGFGTFFIKERDIRKGFHPQNGSPIIIPATRKPAFKPGRTLRGVV